MPEAIRVVPRLEGHDAIFSSKSLIRKLYEDEQVEVGWDTTIGQTYHGTPIDPSNWISVASAATLDRTLKNFVYEDTATEFLTREKNENHVADLICNILNTQSIPERETIAKRLFELLQDVKEEDEAENIGISLGSLRSFYSFLQTHNNLKKPTIALTPANDIYAAWKDERGSVFSVHFLSTGFVRFAIITYDPGSSQPISISGLVNAGSLLKKVRPWGVLTWAGREGR